MERMHGAQMERRPIILRRSSTVLPSRWPSTSFFRGKAAAASTSFSRLYYPLFPATFFCQK